MSRGTVALLVLVVVLSGCAGAGGGGAAPPTTPTVTPAPIPLDPAGPAGELSTGIYPDHMDVSRMAWAHARAAHGHTYRFVVWENRTVRIDGEVVWMRANETRGVVGEDGTYFLTRVSHRVDDGVYSREVTVERYSDGDIEYQRFPGGFIRRYFPNRNWVDEVAVYPLLRYAGTVTTEATDYRRDDRFYVRVYGYNAANPTLENTTSYKVSTLVRADGLVEAFDATFVDRTGGETVFVTVTIDYETVDEVATVPPPPWYEPDV